MARSRAYSDELAGAFKRWEAKGFPDVSNWLMGGKEFRPAGERGNRTGKSAETNINKMMRFASKLQEPKDVQNLIPQAKTYVDVENIQSKIDDFKFNISGSDIEQDIDVFNERVKNSKKVEVDIENTQTLEDLEALDLKPALKGEIKNLEKQKLERLKGLETSQRAEVLERITDEIMISNNVDEAEALKIIKREKLITAEIGAPKYTF